MSELSTVRAAAETPTRLAAYDYDLPAELIAQTPAVVRDAARLLVLERECASLQHRAVHELPALLRAGDLLVFNDARVWAARVHCRATTGAAVELLLLNEATPGRWICLGRPGKRLRVGTPLNLPGARRATVVDRRADGRVVVDLGTDLDMASYLAAYGELPLPPYIKRPDGPTALDGERYQTVFAARDGAVAAPTAGLHFTPALLAALAHAGVPHARITLVVGPGTFLPVRTDDVREHHLEPEWAEISAATVDAIARTKAAGGRVIAVGTTTTRALESAALTGGEAPSQGGAGPALSPGGFWADAFILPGFRFRIVDALLTNFHLPQSTLLMLVSAFAGRERTLDAYAAAVRERYRFYSYGDAMLIL